MAACHAFLCPEPSSGTCQRLPLAPLLSAFPQPCLPLFQAFLRHVFTSVPFPPHPSLPLPLYPIYIQTFGKSSGTRVFLGRPFPFCPIVWMICSLPWYHGLSVLSLQLVWDPQSKTMDSPPTSVSSDRWCHRGSNYATGTGICHQVVFPFPPDNWFLNIYEHATG